MDVDLDGVALDGILPAVEPIFELRARQHGAGPLHQRFQHGELVCREMNRRVVPFHRVRHRIQLDAAMFDGRVAATRRPTRDGTHARRELVQVEGLTR